VEALSALVRQREGDGKDIPVLLRQYLRLSAKILAFSVDRAFGDVLDGLFVVDLAGVERPLLNRYLGRSEAERFLSVHAAR